jgi:CRP-like cAMP-binding protein
MDPSATLRDLLEREGHLIELVRGEFVYRQGEEARHLYLLESGLIGLVTLNVSGKERLVRLFKGGQFLGHRSLLAGEAHHGSARALEASQVRRLPLENFEAFLQSNPSALRQLTQVLARDLRRAELALSAATDASVAERVAESLIYLLDEHAEHQWTRQEIADFSGSSTPTVFRVLADFERRGWVATQRRTIKILQREALLKLIKHSAQ